MLHPIDCKNLNLHQLNHKLQAFLHLISADLSMNVGCFDQITVLSFYLDRQSPNPETKRWELARGGIEREGVS